MPVCGEDGRERYGTASNWARMARVEYEPTPHYAAAY
jgi:hypothetical protein